jgi:hypothetical protein
MKILHKYNKEGEHFETMCGKQLVEDSHLRDDVLLATLELEQEDIDLNFGEDAAVCPRCTAACTPKPVDNVVMLESAWAV